MATVLLLAGCSKRAGDEPSGSSVANLVLELRAEKSEYHVGESFSFRAELVNSGSDPVTVVRPGDGSEYGWRTPIVRWTAAPRQMLRCGNIDPVLPRELVVLQPQQRIALDWLGAPVFGEAGTCTVSLELEHDPKVNRPRGTIVGGQDDEATVKRIRRLPPYRVKSNTVQVLVRE